MFVILAGNEIISSYRYLGNEKALVIVRPSVRPSFGLSVCLSTVKYLCTELIQLFILQLQTVFHLLNDKKMEQMEQVRTS